MLAFDVVVVGAGAAGLFCAALAGQSGLSVLLLDHSAKVAEKIRISGGGRANFTNRDVSAANFLGQNPNFCRSALARYTPQHFIDMVQRHGIAFHEKHKGQLFCDHSAEDLINMLLAECHAGRVTRWQPCAVSIAAAITPDMKDTATLRYELLTERGAVRSRALVVATGGLSIPKIGATDFGYRLARQFAVPVVEPRPALVPLTFDAAAWAPWAALSGLSLPVRIATGGRKNRAIFLEDLLLTHRGLSGPAVLQISSYWNSGAPIQIDLAPGQDLGRRLAQAKSASRKLLSNELAGLVPSRLADAWVARDLAWQRPVNEIADKELARLDFGRVHGHEEGGVGTVINLRQVEHADARERRRSRRWIGTHGQRPLNFGLRLSAKAAFASRVSSDCCKMRLTNCSMRTPVARSMSRPRKANSFAAWTASGAFAPILRA